MPAPFQSVTVLAPAKLNLSLDVVGLLPGGYHALDMVMQAVDLYEQVSLRRSGGLQLRAPGSRVPLNEKNTAYKAALAFFHYTGLLAGADITLRKNTPVRAGMGGGSADAAAVLVGLNALYAAHLSMSELCALGASIGADVPFALMGGTCRVQGLGDMLKALPPCPECWFTVVMPGTEASFLAPLPVRAMSGIGSSAERALGKVGIHTLGQLATASISRLSPIFGVNAEAMRQRAAGLERSAVRRYERGERAPSMEALIALADYYEVSLDYLLGRVNYR